MSTKLIDAVAVVFALTFLWHVVGFWIANNAATWRIFRAFDRYVKARWKHELLAAGIVGCICLPALGAFAGLYALYQMTLMWFRKQRGVANEHETD